MFNEKRVKVVESLKVNFIYFCLKEFSYRGLQSVNHPTFRNHSNQEFVATYGIRGSQDTVRTSTCRLPVPYPIFS
jgi:hypothetical protein